VEEANQAKYFIYGPPTPIVELKVKSYSNKPRVSNRDEERYGTFISIYKHEDLGQGEGKQNL
jgi:hypothetical protein